METRFVTVFVSEAMNEREKTNSQSSGKGGLTELNDRIELFEGKSQLKREV